MSELPRPPRRVPPGADDGTPRPRTVIESRRTQPGRPVRPPRPWYLIPVVVAVLAAGAGAGWLVRVQNSDDPLIGGFDPDDVLKSAGPAVVRVHASTCATPGLQGGTGLATGVFIDSDRVLTAASAVKGPVGVAIETADGQVRGAQVDGTLSGVAVLRVPPVPGKRLDLTVPQLAAGSPADNQDVPVIGFGDDGDQEVDLHALKQSATGDVTGVSGLLPGVSAGAPVFDRGGHTIGLLTRADQSGATGVGLDLLRRLVARSVLPNEERTPKGCKEGKGPQAVIVPRLDGPTGKLATESQDLLSAYLTAVNHHDIPAIRSLFVNGRSDKSDEELEAQYRWESVFSPVIRNVAIDGEGAVVQMTHASLQMPNPDQGTGSRCRIYSLRYDLERVSDKLMIKVVTAADSEGRLSYVPCNEQ